MRPSAVIAIGLIALSLGACATRPEPGTLQAATAALGAGELKSIEYSGTGKWFQFGQAPNPTLPWPEFTVSRFTARVSYDAPAARVEMDRLQVVEPNRARPAPAPQRPVQIVSGTHAWTLAAPAGAAPGTAPAPQAQPAAVEERTMEIWTTPHGFLKAAAQHNATSQASNGGSDITFTMDGEYKYVGRINAQNQVERVQTWIANPVLGDTPVEIAYSDYRDFNGVQFPGRIVRTQGGYPVLDVTVSAVTKNPAVDLPVPDAVRSFTRAAGDRHRGAARRRRLLHEGRQPSQRRHRSDGSHRRRRRPAGRGAFDWRDRESEGDDPEQADPLRGQHARAFRPLGRLADYVAEGATIVTHEMNRPYYEKAWAAPRTINPDRLARRTRPRRSRPLRTST